MSENCPTISFRDQDLFNKNISHQNAAIARSRFDSNVSLEKQLQRDSSVDNLSTVGSRFTVTFFNGRKTDSHDMYARDHATMRRHQEKVGDEAPALPGAKERFQKKRAEKTGIVDLPMHRAPAGQDLKLAEPNSKRTGQKGEDKPDPNQQGSSLARTASALLVLSRAVSRKQLEKEEGSNQAQRTQHPRAPPPELVLSPITPPPKASG
eukprot:CAMPEP_0194558284 /NCGR_PEP_ID=MMETSP0292-20121207/254_1 /TAXON_ID=39354 /ORGANISM="Heterosigma akashiwo, Strain CCMP2393" /LENGTH=207 /DNA_ID=CAMNT_0039405889 /DNA_START=37 /DNA_END=657 /DNA_ORIENTATION=+